MLNKTVNSYKHPQLHERKAVLWIFKTLHEYFYGSLRLLLFLFVCFFLPIASPLKRKMHFWKLNWLHFERIKKCVNFLRHIQMYFSSWFFSSFLWFTGKLIYIITNVRMNEIKIRMINKNNEVYPLIKFLQKYSHY